MTAVARALADLESRWADEGAAAIAATSVDRSRLRAQLTAVREEHGACRVGPALDGDGSRQARLRLECDRGPVEASLQLDEAGALTGATFAPPPGATCAP
jgi:hypothetical protein